jgi:hypothetical protein
MVDIAPMCLSLLGLADDAPPAPVVADLALAR